MGIHLLYYSVFSESGLEIHTDFSYSDETVAEFAQGLKRFVDDFLKNPLDYSAGEDYLEETGQYPAGLLLVKSDSGSIELKYNEKKS